MMNNKTFWNKRFIPEIELKIITEHSTFVSWCLQYFPKKGHILELGAWGGEDSLFLANKGYDVLTTDCSTKALNYIKKRIHGRQRRNVIPFRMRGDEIPGFLSSSRAR